jgi:hypothetical protein
MKAIYEVLYGVVLALPLSALIFCADLIEQLGK